jgi:BolA protein
MNPTSAPAQPTRREILRQKLQVSLQPEHLEVLDESSNHNVPAGSETHFRVLVVTEQFVGTSRLARHRAIHRALQQDLAGGVHALAIDAWTPQEWAARSAPSTSPQCLGGSKK